MVTRHPDERLYVPTTFKETCDALKAPEKIFGNDIGTLVWDDATITVNKALGEKGILTASDPRRIYKDVQIALEEALLHAISKPLHFIVVAQARKLLNEISQVQEITLDVPPSMENTLTSYVDYAFFLNKPTKLGEAPTLQLVPVRAQMSKVKLTRAQWGKPPVGVQEPADLAAVWAKLTGGSGGQGKG
jgi:hypothetical protein